MSQSKKLCNKFTQTNMSGSRCPQSMTYSFTSVVIVYIRQGMGRLIIKKYTGYRRQRRHCIYIGQVTDPRRWQFCLQTFFVAQPTPIFAFRCIYNNAKLWFASSPHRSSSLQSERPLDQKYQGLENKSRNKVFSNMWEGRDPRFFPCPSGHG